MKYKIYVQENVRFSHGIIVEVANCDVDKMLDKAETECCFEDVIGSLEDSGCKIIERIDDEDGDYGDYGNIKIDDFNEIK